MRSISKVIFNFSSPLHVSVQTDVKSERPPLVGEVSANFADRVCRVVSATDPYGR
jgi:hypothetical protein